MFRSFISSFILILTFLLLMGRGVYGQVIVVKPLDIKIDIDETNYSVKTTLRMEAESNGYIADPKKKSRPVLIFPGKKGLIQISFDPLQIPTSIPGVDISKVVFKVLKADITSNSEIHVKGNWQAKDLNHKSRRSMSMNVEMPKGGKLYIQIKYSLEVGDKTINKSFKQQLEVIIEEEIYAYIEKYQTDWERPNYIEYCEKYIKYFSDNRSRISYVESKIIALNNAKWNATDKNDISSLLAYMNSFENPTKREEALKTLRNLESQDWNNAKSNNTIKAYDNYRKVYGKIISRDFSTHVAEASNQISIVDEDEWRRATLKDNPQAYRDYLELFRGTQITPIHNLDAKRGMTRKPVVKDTGEEVKEDPELKLWRLSLDLNTVEAYEKYLEQCPKWNCKYKEEALDQIQRIQPLAIDIQRDTTNGFHYSLIVKNGSYPYLDSFLPETGVEISEWTHDSLKSTVEIYMQDEEVHIFYLLDSLGKRDTFEINVSILPIKSTVNIKTDELIFNITGGFPPYFVQFEREQEGPENWLSGLYTLGESNASEKPDQWKIPIDNLSPNIIAGTYNVIIKDSRSESFSIADFDLDRPQKRPLWVYLLGPLVLLMGFLGYRNIEL